MCFWVTQKFYELKPATLNLQRYIWIPHGWGEQLLFLSDNVNDSELNQNARLQKPFQEKKKKAKNKSEYRESRATLSNVAVINVSRNSVFVIIYSTPIPIIQKKIKIFLNEHNK